MKYSIRMMAALAAGMWLQAAAAQETGQKARGEESVDSKKPAAAAIEKPTRAELEQRFRMALTDAVFSGTWQMTGAPDADGKTSLSAPAADKYTISKVTRISGDRWLIFARIEYGDTDLTLPVPVRVVWAEDTPIITVNDMKIPGGNTYSARVMVYRNFYSGTWFGDCDGGILSGQILRGVDEKKTQSEATGK